MSYENQAEYAKADKVEIDGEFESDDEEPIPEQVKPTMTDTTGTSTVRIVTTTSGGYRSNRDEFGVDAKTGKALRHSDSPFHSPKEAALVAELSFKSFAPKPCVCCKCFVSDHERQRTYGHVYENHFETNQPCNIFLCCGTNDCIADNVTLKYFDNLGVMAPFPCCCIPCFCCGSPAVYEYVPMWCFCIDCTPWCGRTVFMSPCDCHGLRCFICCGTPCFMNCLAQPIAFGTKGATDWLGKMRKAVRLYGEKHGVTRKSKLPKVYKVVDIDCCGCGTTTQIPEFEGEVVTREIMERG